MKTPYILALCLGVALAARVAVLMTHEPDKKAWGDSAQYVNLGASVADGKGFVLYEGNYWPGKPTIIRAPGWPLALSFAFRVFPVEWRWEVAMGLAVLLDGINVLLIYLLARGVGGGKVSGLASAFLYALSPVMAAWCLFVASEVMGITLILVFLNYFVRIAGAGHPDVETALSGSKVKMGLAGLFLGLAALVRPNFLLIGFVLAAGLLWTGRRKLSAPFVVVSVFIFASLVPLSPWLIRNAMVFGSFPILGAGGGETLYGGNNDLAAERGGVREGYLILPGDLPREKSLVELAAVMNEFQVDRYYLSRGVEWIREHISKMPRLVLMKITRAYIPISPSRKREVLVANLYRAVVDLLAIGGLVILFRKGRKLPWWPSLAFVSVFLAHIALAAVFCGLNRFALPSEILLVIPAGYALAMGGKWMGGILDRHPHPSPLP